MKELLVGNLYEFVFAHCHSSKQFTFILMKHWKSSQLKLSIYDLKVVKKKPLSF